MGNEKARERGIIRVWTLIDIDIVVEPKIRIRQVLKLKEETSLKPSKFEHAPGSIWLASWPWVWEFENRMLAINVVIGMVV